MSRGVVRSKLKARIEPLVAGRKLPFHGGDDELQVPEVFEQLASVDNDETERAPCVIVRVGKVRQARNPDGPVDSRVGEVEIVCLVYAEDSVQGYRDAENLIELIEIDLIANPWLGAGTYELIGPWESDITDDRYPVFFAVLKCGVQMIAVQTTVGPDGRPLEEDI